MGAWTGPVPPIGVSVPRWSTLRRAVKLAMASKDAPGMYPFDRFSDHAKSLLTLAQKEAEKEKFSYIGTEHLLFAAFGKPEFHSAKILKALGVEEADVREKVRSKIIEARPPRVMGMIPTSRVKKVIEIAFQLCASRNAPRVGTDHILLALTIEGEGIAARVLKDLGASRKKVEAELGQLTDPEA